MRRSIRWPVLGRGDGGEGGDEPNNDRTGDSNRNGNNNSSNVYRELRQVISSWTFAEFRQGVLVWLGAKGYRHIFSLGRHSERGRRSIGGADFIAQAPGTERATVAIQIRYCQTPVQRRAVDELRGFMLRHQVPLGLIVTNGSFLESSRQAALSYTGRPVTLVSGAQLAGSFAALGLGVRYSRRRHVLDRAFFRTIATLASSLRDTSQRRGRNLAEARSDSPEVFLRGLGSRSWQLLTAIGLVVLLALLITLL